MPSIASISQVGDVQGLAVTQPRSMPEDRSAVRVFEAALRGGGETSETSSSDLFELVGTTAKGLREDREHVDAAFKTAIDTLDPWEMGKAAIAMSEYNHATQLATKLLNHATQSIDQLSRGS